MVGESARRVAVLFRDVTARKRQEAHAAFLASVHDDLSHLGSADEILQAVGARLGAYLRLATCSFIDVDESAAEGSRPPLTLTDVRIGAHDGFDRIVFELAGDGQAGWQVGFTGAPRSQGSGRPVDVPPVTEALPVLPKASVAKTW